MTWMKWLLIVAVALAALVLLAGRLGLVSGKPPGNLGLREGKFKPPSKTPNSVSSQADLWPDHPLRDSARIAPLAYRGDGAAALARLAAQLRTMPGATVVEARADYVYATFETKLMRYVDDAEFWLDPAGSVIQLRSASRVGRKDFGVNRARIEAIRARFESAG
jgi:uncharacterized protein (DUF1499 family)